MSGESKDWSLVLLMEPNLKSKVQTSQPIMLGNAFPAFITALGGLSGGFVSALRRAFGIRNRLPEFLDILFLREQNQRRQNDKEQDKKLARRVQGTLDFLFSTRACFVHILLLHGCPRGSVS